MAALDVSVVIPLLNEEPSLAELHRRLVAVFEQLGVSYELIFVDDGSTDGSGALLDALARTDPRVGVVHFRRNFGKAAALDAGFQRSRGSYVFTMDADLQDAPEELVAMLAKLREGFDAVSGWKKRRHDPLSKTLPSKLFNWAVSRISGLRLHDFNCGLKGYRADAIAGLRLYGEMHRFVPVLLHWDGFRVTELEVHHEARRFGVSKYGPSRLAKGFFDLLTVVLNTRYRSRPLHLFGLAGLLLGAAGSAMLAYLVVLWFLGYRPIGQRPLLFFGLLLVMVGVQLVSTGLLGELITRQHHDAEEYYVIREYTAPRAGDEQRTEVPDDQSARAPAARALP
jgi:glycosyltransferase involved in cell wall biosynthesis